MEDKVSARDEPGHPDEGPGHPRGAEGRPAEPDPAGAEETVVEPDVVGDLGPIRLRHPPGTFSLTPASRITLEAVARRSDLLAGTGIDWGTGVGGLAVLAARIRGVDGVVGLDLSRANVETARANARRNGVARTTRFVAADSFETLDPADRDLLGDLRGRVDFLLANPPTASHGDGFAFRRRILREARDFLRPGAVALLQISSQYSLERIRGLEADAPGFRWMGCLATTKPVPFDLRRPDLLACLELYARAESEGHRPYTFLTMGEGEAVTPDEGRAATSEQEAATPGEGGATTPGEDEAATSGEGGTAAPGAGRAATREEEAVTPGAGDPGTLTARAALDRFRAEGRSPLSRWQVHGFRLR